MNRRIIVLLTAIGAVAIFGLGAIIYSRSQTTPLPSNVATAMRVDLVRPHSPVIGPPDAPVTIVEFFDPSCEACRAFYPIVKQIMATYPADVRLVLRYTAFHTGSDEAIRILETARLQGKLEPVLEALLNRQPEWAIHDSPDLGKAWEIAGAAGLNIELAKAQLPSSAIEEVIRQDQSDVQTNRVQQTPTFFVNGRPLPSFGPEQLLDLVVAEVNISKIAVR